MSDLSDTLNIEVGINAFIGGGGKTSSLLQVAKELGKSRRKVIVTTTTKMYALREDEVECVLLGNVLEEVIEELKLALRQYDIIGIGSKVQDGKMLGIACEWVDKLKDSVDYVLVEADGARRLPIKAPGAYEPVIPTQTKRVIVVVGWSGVGEVIGEKSFRPEIVSEIVGKTEMEILEAKDLVTLISHPKGLQKGVGKRFCTVLINQVDNEEDAYEAMKVAMKLKNKGMTDIVISTLKQKKWKQIDSKKMKGGQRCL